MGACIQSKKKTSINPTAIDTFAGSVSEKPGAKAANNGAATPIEIQRKSVKPKAIPHDHTPMEDLTEAITAKVTNKPKTSWELQLISMALQKHSVLSELAEEVKEVVIEKMRHFLLGADEVVFEEGSSGAYFFVVASGSLEVQVAGRRVNKVKAGDSFGEQALLHSTNRSATLRTLERCTLWGVDGKTFREAVATVNAANYRENQRFIDSVGVFMVLTTHEREALLSNMTLQRFKPGTRIVTEGDSGDLFYIIKEGTVTCTISGVEVRKLGKGDFFGEQSLLYNTPRTATVTSIDPVKVYSIGRNQLTEALGDSFQLVMYRNTMRMAMDRGEFLRRMTKEQKEALVGKMEVVDYQTNAVVIPAGTDVSTGIWMVLRGTLSVEEGKEVKKLECVGEKEVFLGEKRRISASIIALEPTNIAFLSKSQMEALLGTNISAIFARNEALTVLKQVLIFKSFSTDKLILLLNAMETAEYDSDSCIVTQGEEGNAFYIVLSGKVQIEKDGVVVRTINKHDYFGERSILFAEPRTATVRAQGSVLCWVLRQEVFARIIDDQLRKHLIGRIQLQDVSVRLEDLRPVKSLGKGMFGHVTLCVNIYKATLYALKTVSRKKVRLYDLSENLLLERHVLLQLDHSLIMKLVRTYKDEDRLYFLLEYVHGQDLFDVLRVMGLLEDQDAKFYTACLVLILEHLHERDIIYRDLKPENIMIDDVGYPRLIDFGTAKILTQGRTFTTVGTPHYTAPEVLLGKGYGVSADYWSLGVMIYEFICGQVPFGEDEEDTYAVYEKVLRQNLVYPRALNQYFPARNLIEILLNRNPSARTAGGSERLKGHRWFHDVNWVGSK